jgi:3D (Asp-Asp-Asp) domain-containing protein
MVCRALIVILLGGCISPRDDESVGVVQAASVINDAQITYYTVAEEAKLTGTKTGDYGSFAPRGLGGKTYKKEFICSAWGVAMQGTGLGLDGKYVHWKRGGGCWLARDGRCTTSGDRQRPPFWLNNCESAEFEYVNKVTGASGRELVENYSCAVDPKVIPLGSYVWMESEQRWCRADDTGGWIKGNHIDIFRGRNNARTVSSGQSRLYTTTQRHAWEDGSPWAGTDGTAACPPSTPVDCGPNSNSCCPVNFPMCCPDGVSCSLAGCGTGAVAQDCSIDCGNGKCCPSSAAVCCENGRCARTQAECGGTGPLPTTPGCPAEAGEGAVSCADGCCCPSDAPVCCGQCTCGETPDDCGGGPPADACPADYPVDCAEQLSGAGASACCPTAQPVCCPDGLHCSREGGIDC